MKLLLVFILFVSSLQAFKIEQEFNIKTLKVQEKNRAPYKEFYGKIVPNENNIYDVNIRFDGFITKLYTPNKFQYIKKGDRLFDIYSKEIYNLFDELELAKKSSDKLYQSSKNKLKLFNINEKDKIGDSVRIRSKIDGYITKNNIKHNSFVKKGQSIFEITDLKDVWLVINVYQKDIGFIKKGMIVEAKVDGVNKIIQSKVDYIYPTLNPKDQTIPVRVEVKNTELTFLPNMFAKIKVYEKEQKIVIVPKNAVVKRDGKLYVFFKDGKEYSPSEINAVRIPEGYKIIEGLEVGDIIVQNALFLLDSDAVTNGLYSDDW